MNRSHFVALLSILVAGCGSGDTRRAGPVALSPASSADTPAAAAQAPQSEQSEQSPSPSPPEPATEELVALFEPDSRPEEPPAEPVTALSPALRVREAPRITDRGEVFPVRYPLIELSDEAARADLDAQLQRAIVFAASRGGLGPSRGRCRATLATAELVSVLCELTTPSRDGIPSRPNVEAITFRLSAAGARPVSVEDAFVPMSRVERAICAVAAGPGNSCTGLELALAPDHLVVRWHRSGEDRIRSTDVPYSDVAPLLRRDGILGFAASDAPATSAAALAGAPEPCRAWGAPATLPAIGAAILATGIIAPRLVALDAGGGLLRAISPYPSELSAHDAEALAAALGAPETVECAGRFVVVGSFRTTHPVVLFPAPDPDRAQLEAQAGTLSAGAHAIRFDRAGPGRFAMSPHPGTWSYVVGEQARGWAFATAVHRSL